MCFCRLSQPPFVSYLSTFLSRALWIIWFLRFIFPSWSTRQPWVLGYHFWISGSGLSATGSHFGFSFLGSGFYGFYGSGYRYRWLHCGESSPFPFRRDRGKLITLIFGCRSSYTYHLIGCNSMPPCFHSFFKDRQKITTNKTTLHQKRQKTRRVCCIISKLFFRFFFLLPFSFFQHLSSLPIYYVFNLSSYTTSSKKKQAFPKDGGDHRCKGGKNSSS